MRDLPHGTVTFLFTDIEGSTKLLTRLGDAFADLLAGHHRVMRDAIAAHDGIEIKTEGDAFFVVFESAPRAAAAAVAAQTALAGHEWPEGADVRVRMGLHTGEGLAVGDNYGGIDVHRAARIANAGHGGQVLVSDATRALVESSLPDGVEIRDLGSHRLKDLERPEHLYQLVVEGLPSEFPPPRSLDARPNNLPQVLGGFVPRAKEVVEICALLREQRLVTLTGPGGTGKTRLSLKVGGELLDAFADGVFFVSLSAVSDHSLVVPTIADVLGVKESSMDPLERTLSTYLADKTMLLILDNFEQVLEAAPTIAELVTAAPTVKALATSRAPLHVYGEQEYPVPPMHVADPARGSSFEEIADSEAVQLFVQRARAVNPSFELTGDSAPLVAEICARLDGLPLAIELAAARSRLFGPQDLVRRLDRSLSVLTSGAHDLPSRQRTLRGAIAWSYDLLDEPTRAFFDRLGVFAGGWMLDAAESVTRPDELGVDSLAALEVLIDHNLVRRYETDLGETRCRMLQTIREYALEMLATRDDLGATRAKHAATFLALAEEAEPEFTKDKRWGERLTIEHDNTRTALEWCLASGETEKGLRLAAAMWRFWQIRGHLTEARRWLSRLLDAHPSHDAARAKALSAIGSIAYWQNDFDACARFYDEALAAYRDLGDRRGIAEALYNRAFLALIDNRPDDAKGLYEESRALYRELGDELGLASTSWGLAMGASMKRDLKEARKHAEEAHRLSSKLGNWFGTSLAEWIFAYVLKFEGDHDASIKIMVEQAEQVARHGDLLSVASVCEGVGDSELLRGNPRRGLRLAAAGVAIRRRVGGGAPPPLMLLSGEPRELARAYLSEEEIERAWAEGEAMSPEEALAYLKKDPEDETSP